MGRKPLIGVYPGTFDPVTFGHLDIINRAAPLFDKLIIGVALNAGKDPLFSVSGRVLMLEHEIKILGLDNVEVKSFDNLLINFAKSEGASVLVRGLRAISDFEYEFQMAGTNRRMAPELETMFLMASESNQLISSRFVKEIALMGGAIEHFVPENVCKNLVKS